MALAVAEKNRHYRWKEIHTRHWMEMAKRNGFADMKIVIADVVARTPGVIHEVQRILPNGFPAQIAGPILGGIEACAKQLASELFEG